MRTLFSLIFLLLLLFSTSVIAGGTGPLGPEKEANEEDIKLIYAEGKIFYHEIYVHWTTEYEKTACEFIIERSIDKEQWFFRGRVRASGNSNELREYQYIDSREDKYKYYRIKKLDGLTGSTVLREFELENYSIKVDLHNVQMNHTKTLVIEYSIDKGQEILLRIYNRIGEQVVTKLMPFRWAGDFLYHLDVSHLKSGNYLLVVTQTLLDKSVAEKQFTLK